MKLIKLPHYNKMANSDSENNTEKVMKLQKILSKMEIQKKKAQKAEIQETNHHMSEKKGKPNYKWCCDKLTTDNVIKAKQLLNDGDSVSYVSQVTGISEYYLRQLKKGQEIPTDGKPRPTKPRPINK